MEEGLLAGICIGFSMGVAACLVRDTIHRIIMREKLRMRLEEFIQREKENDCYKERAG